MEALIGVKLYRLGDLSNDDRGRLAGLLTGRRRAAAGEALVEEGSRPTFSTLLISGFVGRISTLADGGRQITAIRVPLDFIDLHGFLLKTMDHSLVAL
ncbi:cyclic nucleotide-binding domain-containing protein [Brevundimonas sp. Leaf168]|uniref:cyclic nucleotide-binding domain-containing protein n=1 Tax=Brevundimonas sp. Leaf168 TaxID=1736283 RepID=UPI0012E1FF90|nr:cyclic nucleotide-binding domain-containing protein [Brevundimonas sp. Leaf168]